YFYRAITFNSCKQPKDTSNICNSILLSAFKLNKAENRLTWSKYFNFDAGVSKYEIYSGSGDISSGHNFSLLTTLIPDSNGYNDNQFPEIILNDGVCYYILAYENSGN